MAIGSAAENAPVNMDLEYIQDIVRNDLKASAFRDVAQAFSQAPAPLGAHTSTLDASVRHVVQGWKGQAAAAASDTVIDTATNIQGTREASTSAGDALHALAQAIEDAQQRDPSIINTPPDVSWSAAYTKALSTARHPAAVNPEAVRNLQDQAQQAYDSQQRQAAQRLQSIIDASQNVGTGYPFTPVTPPKTRIYPGSLPDQLSVPAHGSAASGGGRGGYTPSGSGASVFAPPVSDSGADFGGGIPGPLYGGAASSSADPNTDPRTGLYRAGAGSARASTGDSGGAAVHGGSVGATTPAASGSYVAPPGQPAPVASAPTANGSGWGAVAAGTAGAALLGAAGGGFGNRVVTGPASPGSGGRSGRAEDGGSGEAARDESPRLTARETGTGTGVQPGSGSGAGAPAEPGADESMPATDSAGEAGAANELSAAERGGLYPPLGGVRRRDDDDDEITHNPDWMVEVKIGGVIRRVAPPTIGAPETFRNE